MVRLLVSSWDGLFSGATLVSGGDRRISEPSTVSRVENEIKGPDSYHAPGTHAQSGVQFLRCGNFFVFEKESQQRNSTIHLPKSKFDFKKPFSHWDWQLRSLIAVLTFLKIFKSNCFSWLYIHKVLFHSSFHIIIFDSIVNLASQALLHQLGIGFEEGQLSQDLVMFEGLSWRSLWRSKSQKNPTSVTSCWWFSLRKTQSLKVFKLKAWKT